MASYHPLECLLVTLLLSTYFPTNYAQLENTAQPVVTIPQGTLAGIIVTTRNDRNVSTFLGIPFAQPPIGSLRFANPVAADGWSGTLNASVDSSMCPQFISNAVQGEEDCLYLNVFTPQLPETTNSSLLPVMVFIHGGAFKMASQASTAFGLEYLLDEDVVLVAPNYRLGPLGFLSTGDEVASGNWGLKDQVLALQWVQDNIKYFGGDPERVTLFGESAGSASVHLLTLSNATIGLFHRYITQSGSALSTWAYRPRAAYSSRAYELGVFVGCSNDTSDSLISCLRTINVSNIIATESQFIVWESFPDIVWGPTDEPEIEGAILTDSPSNLFAAGKIRDLPWISGVDRDEGLIQMAAFYEDEAMLYDFLENIDSFLPIMLSWTYRSDSGASWVNVTKSYYFNNDFTANASVLLKNLTALATDSHFYYPAHKAIEQHCAMAENPQYFYTFNYRGTYSYSYWYGGSSTNYGVAHGDELIYLFRDETVSPDGELTLSETDLEMVNAMVQLWTSFAINGTPTAGNAVNGITEWEPYSDRDNYLRIGNESDVALENQYSFFEERMRFWASIDVHAAEEAEDTSVEGSGTLILSPNLFSLLFIASAKFLLF